MQKYTFLTAIAVLAAFIVLLVACGEGEPNNLDQAELNKIKLAMINLQDSIKACGKNPDSPSCPNENGSSSGDGTSSPNDDSSNSNNTSSSSGGDGGGDDDSSNSNASSPSKPPDEFNKDCPESDRDKIPNFTCSWTPPEVKGGNNSKLTLSIIPPNTMTCTPGKAWRALFGCTEGATPENCIKRDTAYFPFDKDMVTSGVYQSMKNGNLKDSYKQWPKKDSNFVVYGELTCGNNCRRTLPCTALNITPATEPKFKDKVKLTCNWQKLPEGATEIFGNLAIGTPLTPCELKDEDNSNNKGLWLLSNNSGEDGAGCKTVDIEYSPANYNASKVGTIITVKAVANGCRGGKYELITFTYNVVADPSLSETCTWNTENNVYLGGATPVFGTPVPTVNNNYGRCSTTPILSLNGTSVYTTLPNVLQGQPQKINLRAYPACPAGTPYGAGIKCPEITVKNKADACDYVAATHCPGVTNKASIITTAQNCPSTGTCGNNSKEKCYYATSITRLKVANNSGDVKVNGQVLSGNEKGNCDNNGDWDLPSCTSILANVTKVDGGYYIYVGNKGWTDNGFVTQNTQNGLHPNCR